MVGRVVEIATDGRHLSIHRGFLVVAEGSVPTPICWLSGFPIAQSFCSNRHRPWRMTPRSSGCRRS